jgi:hypothetical protein
LNGVVNVYDLRLALSLKVTRTSWAIICIKTEQKFDVSEAFLSPYSGNDIGSVWLLL